MGQHSGTVSAEKSEAFLITARQATAKYQNQAAAILDGYRRIGRDFPAMGEHWLKIALLFDGKFDAARPEILTYVNVSGKPKLLGAAYALPLLSGELPPDHPVPGKMWHDHSGTLDDETFLPHDHSGGHGDHPARLAMLHAWLWTENPEGVFAADNWSIPYVRLGIPLPSAAPEQSAKALSLNSGGGEHLLSAIEIAARIDNREREAIRNAIARSSASAKDILRDRAQAGISASELQELSDVWNELRMSIHKSVRPETRERLNQLSIP
jgi:hypothetical protein